MIIDVCTYFNERELLDLRIETLKDIVDQFVIIEANRTHAGEPKDFTLNEPIARNVRVLQADISGYEGDWGREGAQRNAAQHVINAVDSEDIVMISDVDEIPNPNMLGKTGVYQMKLYTYYLNVLCPYPWKGTIALTADQWGRYPAPNEARQQMHMGMLDLPVHEGGWHFSSLGGVERVRTKLRSYAHQEYNTPEHLEKVAERVANLEDVFGRGEKYEKVGLKGLPLPVQKHPELYEEFLL